MNVYIFAITHFFWRDQIAKYDQLMLIFGFLNCVGAVNVVRSYKILPKKF